MEQLKFTPFPTIATERLILRRATIEDKKEIFILKSDDEVLKYLDNLKHNSIDETENFIRKIDDGITNNEWINWAITLKNSTKVIGTICLWNISKEHSAAELGYELLPPFQGKGIMQESLNAVIEYAFKNIKFNSLSAYTNKYNLKSINLLERNGFIDKTYKNNNSLDDNKIYRLINLNT